MELLSKSVWKLCLVQDAAAGLLARVVCRNLIISVYSTVTSKVVPSTNQSSGLDLQIPHLHQYPQPLWPSLEGLLWVPLPSEIRNVSNRKRAFSLVASKLWNSFPRDICLSPSVAIYHQWVKTLVLLSVCFFLPSVLNVVFILFVLITHLCLCFNGF